MKYYEVITNCFANEVSARNDSLVFCVHLREVEVTNLRKLFVSYVTGSINYAIRQQNPVFGYTAFIKGLVRFLR
jgi:hypothetical protein